MVQRTPLSRLDAKLERAGERARRAWARVEREENAAVRAREEVFSLELDAARLRARAVATG